MTSINPYLNFDGTAEEAMNFYKGVFGGEFMGPVMRWGEAPGCDEFNLTEENKGKVMHMALPISDGNVIMASDSIKGLGPALETGNNVSIAIGPKSREEADRLFAGLSEGGQVGMPMSRHFGAGTSGALWTSSGSIG